MFSVFSPKQSSIPANKKEQGQREEGIAPQKVSVKNNKKGWYGK